MTATIEYKPEGGDGVHDTLQLARKQVWFVCGLEVKPCDLLVTHGPYLSALEIKGLYIKRYINLFVYLLTLHNKTRNNLRKYAVWNVNE